MSGRRSDAAAGECVLAERRERLKNMYYTIEGKRFLCILYIAGLLFGSLFINLSIRMELFRTTDFLGFTEYIRSMEGLDTGAFFSYVCLVRFRQLLIFFCVFFSFLPMWCTASWIFWCPPFWGFSFPLWFSTMDGRE